MSSRKVDFDWLADDLDGDIVALSECPRCTCAIGELDRSGRRRSRAWVCAHLDRKLSVGEQLRSQWRASRDRRCRATSAAEYREANGCRSATHHEASKPGHNHISLTQWGLHVHRQASGGP